MVKRFLSLVTIWAVVVGCGFTFSPAAQPREQAPAGAPALSPDLQMRVLENRAKFDMLLYEGPFGQTGFGLPKAGPVALHTRW